ncbi:YbgC/FadM family acyl-CoA thioesterase [Candidatus Sororendozoicomonas aggregata]|uniref:YbgC/FadM family acyl-CoA thioesterase n=1 Tax=Candidatus Sororendozoicomonas aggregata TaxID=3073239 RepID=UPI002ED6266F
MDISSVASFFWPVRIYHQDTDSSGVVFHPNYMSFMERARTELLRKYGVEMTRILAEHSRIFVVAEANVKYHHPAKLDDSLWATADIVSVGRSRVVFCQRVLLQDNLRSLCTGRIIIACVDAKTLKPARLPASVVSAFGKMYQQRMRRSEGFSD